MTQAQRLVAALDGGQGAGRPVADRAGQSPPAAPIYLSLYLEPPRRRLLARVYAEMAEGASSLRLSFDDEVAACVEAQVRAMSLFSTPPAWAPIHLGPAQASAEGAKVTFPAGQCLWHPPGQGRPTDFLAFFDNRHADLWEVDAGLPSVDDVRGQSRVHTAASYLDVGCGEYPARLIRRLGDRFVPVGGMGTPFWHCYARLGFSGMMRSLRESPELIDAVVADGLAADLAHAEALWQCGVRYLFVEECLSSSDLISVDDYRRFAYPSTHDFLTALRGIGFRTVYYYCGGVEGRLEYLAGLPVAALAFEESKKGFIIDLARVRREIGPDMPLLGNTEAVLLRDGTEEEIVADVARQYASAGPQFIVSMGSPATLDTPPAKLDMLVRASDQLGGCHR